MQTNLKLKSVEPDAQPLDAVVVKAAFRSRLGVEIGAQLNRAALACGDDDAEAVAGLITESANPKNVVVGFDVYNEFGEMFDALFVLALMSSSRLCQSYVADSARRARKKVLARIEAYKPRSDSERLRLLTLTMPKFKGVGLAKTFAIFDDAWRRFRKCKWWRARIRAACKGEEFTLGDVKKLKREGRAWNFEQDGYHVHAHILAW